MIDHTGIRVADLESSKRFYEQALAPLGYTLRKEFPGAAGFGVPAGHGQSLDPGGDFWISCGEPYTPRPHIAFSAASRTAVDAFYEAAIAAGGRDNGPPGLRLLYHPSYYAAFVFDPDGYNIEAVCHLALDSRRNMTFT
jgi:catechol 2,3-dioxygenase-like lactoylglutathione lyase family enzyme